MYFVGYALLWLFIFGLFELLYGRHARKVMRVLLGEATTEEYRHSVLERVHQFLDRLWALVKR